MALIDEVKTLCNRLADGGWHNLLLHHGLDIKTPCLAYELRKPLRIDRTQPGFEDFCPAGLHAIEPGKPAQSLLYHALASPNVTHDAQGKPLTLFPTTVELETVLNLTYGIEPPSIDALVARAQGAPLAVVVFAHEYRPAPDTVHKAHADLCFSRTGIARVGTMPPLYDEQARGFLPFVEGDNHGIRVLPARYSAYIAVQRQGDRQGFGPMRFQDTDDNRHFWVPLHKLFSGTECIAGLNLDLTLQARHKNEKLRRIHLALGNNSGWGEPDISRPPFVMTQGLAEWMSVYDWPNPRAHDSGLLVPLPRARLVEAAYYQGRPLSFRVPDRPSVVDSSLEIRLHAPEYVHIRHRVEPTGEVVNLNQSADMVASLKKGGFSALHYLDFTADGAISAACAALDTHIPARIPAYSLIAAPDFYPLCIQRHLSEWLESMPADVQKVLFSQLPDCLCDTRAPANVGSFADTFDWADTGVTAIVAQLAADPAPAAAPGKLSIASPRRASYLPDAAAGLFAPGWDVGNDFIDNDSDKAHLAAYRLGSPFPEDAKLCAALSSYWPAVAPDSVQQFEPAIDRHTVKPMLDSEIGVEGHLPWDGIPAPRRYIDNGKPHIGFTSSLYGDYTQSALDGTFSLALTGKVNSNKYKQRVYALHRVRQVIGKDSNEWRITSFRVATKEDIDSVNAFNTLNIPADQSAYRFELARLEPATSPAFDQVHFSIIERSTFLVWPQQILRQPENRPWELAESPVDAHGTL